MKKHNRPIIGIIGLGYVGLPLALELSKYFIVKGLDYSHGKGLHLINSIKNYFQN